MLEENNENMENNQNLNTNLPAGENMKNFFDYNDQNLNENENSTNNDYNNIISRYALKMLSTSNSNYGQDLLKTTNLINELIELEQQNKIQVELIKRIIHNKYEKINYVNNILENYISQTPTDKILRELSTNTKTNSNFNSQQLDANKNQQTFNFLEDNKPQSNFLKFLI